MGNQQTTAESRTNGAAPAMCSRCGVNPRADAKSTNPWCLECKADAQREYEQKRLAQKERHGYALGVRETKELLASEFDRLGFASFSAIEVRDLILRAPGPKLPED